MKDIEIKKMVSASEQAAAGKLTADAVSAVRALATFEPDEKLRNPDRLARSFVTNPSLLPDTEKERQRLVTAYESVIPGAYYFHNARTFFLDEIITRAMDEGASQVVILGAGYDTRPYRLNRQGVTFFEVDLPDLQEIKKEKIKYLLGALPKSVKYVPVDFNASLFSEMLETAGFKRDRMSAFIWEGVIYYLSPEGVHATLSQIRDLTYPGSMLALDTITRAMAKGSNAYYGAAQAREYVASVGEPYTYGIEDDELAGFFGVYGFRLESLLLPDMIEDAWLMGTDGRLSGRVLGFNRFVSVRKTN